MASLNPTRYRMAIGSIENPDPSQFSFTMTLENVSEEIRNCLHSLLSETLRTMARRYKTLPPNGCLFPHNSKIRSTTLIFKNIPMTCKECDPWLKCAISIAYTCHRLFRACLKYDQGIFFRSDLIASVRETRYKITHRPRRSPVVEEFNIEIPPSDASSIVARYKIEILQYSCFSPELFPRTLQHLRNALFGNSRQPWVKDYLIPLSQKYHISLDIPQNARPKNLKNIFLHCFNYLDLIDNCSNSCSQLIATYHFNKCIEHCRDCNIALTLTSLSSSPIAFPPTATLLSESASSLSSPPPPQIDSEFADDIAGYLNPVALQIDTSLPDSETASTGSRRARSDNDELPQRSVRLRFN